MKTNKPTIEEQKEFWNSHWGNWRDRKTINEWKDRRHKAILALVRGLLLNGAKILDLGCGPGHYTKSLREFGEVTGIDLSDEAITVAKSKYPHIQFLTGNLYDFPFPLNAFDIVVSQEVFDHVEDQVAFLERVAEILRPHGYLILSCTNRFVADREDSPDLGLSHIRKYLTMKELRGLLRCHFRVLHMRSIIPLGHRGILRLINSHKLNSAISRLIPAPTLESWKEWAGCGYQLIVLGQKRA